MTNQEFEELLQKGLQGTPANRFAELEAASPITDTAQPPELKPALFPYRRMAAAAACLALVVTVTAVALRKPSSPPLWVVSGNDSSGSITSIGASSQPPWADSSAPSSSGEGDNSVISQPSSSENLQQEVTNAVAQEATSIASIPFVPPPQASSSFSAGDASTPQPQITFDSDEWGFYYPVVPDISPVESMVSQAASSSPVVSGPAANTSSYPPSQTDSVEPLVFFGNTAIEQFANWAKYGTEGDGASKPAFTRSLFVTDRAYFVPNRLPADFNLKSILVNSTEVFWHYKCDSGPELALSYGTGKGQADGLVQKGWQKATHGQRDYYIASGKYDGIDRLKIRWYEDGYPITLFLSGTSDYAPYLTYCSVERRALS